MPLPTENVTRTGRPRRKLGPHSRCIDRGVLGSGINGNSREGRFLRVYETMLTKHVGGAPSWVQLEIIRRCARLALRLELMDEKALAAGSLSDSSARDYLTWHRTLMGSLRRLGVGPAPPAVVSDLAAYLAARATPSANHGAPSPP